MAVPCKDPVNFLKFPLDLVRAQDLVPPAGTGRHEEGNKPFDATAAAGAPRWVISAINLRASDGLIASATMKRGGFLAVYDASVYRNLVKEPDYLKI